MNFNFRHLPHQNWPRKSAKIIEIFLKNLDSNLRILLEKPFRKKKKEEGRENMFCMASYLEHDDKKGREEGWRSALQSTHRHAGHTRIPSFPPTFSHFLTHLSQREKEEKLLFGTDRGKTVVGMGLQIRQYGSMSRDEKKWSSRRCTAGSRWQPARLRLDDNLQSWTVLPHLRIRFPWMTLYHGVIN